MKLSVSIKTAKLPALRMSADVETFEHVGRMGKKLESFAKNAIKLLPDLKGAEVEEVRIEVGEGGAKRKKRGAKPGASGGEGGAN